MFKLIPYPEVSYPEVSDPQSSLSASKPPPGEPPAKKSFTATKLLKKPINWQREAYSRVVISTDWTI